MNNTQFDQRKKVVYDLICDPAYVPMKQKELAVILQVTREERPQLEEILLALIDEGKIEVSKRGKYKRAESHTLTGVFTANPRGFGFVTVEGMEEDIFIPEECIHEAMHQDVVRVSVKPGKAGRRKEGEITAVVEHGIHEVVGTYQKCGAYGFVVPDNLKILQDIFIPGEKAKGAVNGHKVLAEITGYGSRRKSPEGEIKEILGHKNDPGTDILSIVYAHELPTAFPPETLAQAEGIRDELTEEERTGRLDLRDTVMVTIDGEDAKDLDDAVSLTFDGELYHLGVHIADVSHYVAEGSPLDREALERGTSVYLVDRVIPMLPHRLSNGICSLNQGEDRLALSCLMDIDQKGNILSHRIAETVIRVNRRMSYTEVAGLLSGAGHAGAGTEEEAAAQGVCADGRAAADRKAALQEEYGPIYPMIFQMGKLSALLRTKRHGRGAVDFDFPESKIILDEQGRPTEIRPYERNAATKLIEDFMLAANETVAEEYFWQSLPFVYRIHEQPDPDKIQTLAMFIRSFGYGMKGIQAEVHPKEIQKLLDRVEGTPEEAMISRMTLRSMKQAKYAPECTGHFGLAAKYYCHFTSPIRRYPDLQIHRIIKENLHGQLDEARIIHYESVLDGVCDQCSRRERRADEAERDTIKMKKAEYMQGHIGERVEGVISGMTTYGLYVELPNTVEGMVHVTNILGDRFYFHEDAQEMTGVSTGRTYRLGQRVKVQVIGADKQQRTVDFLLDEEGEDE